MEELADPEREPSPDCHVLAGERSSPTLKRKQTPTNTDADVGVVLNAQHLQFNTKTAPTSEVSAADSRKLSASELDPNLCDRKRARTPPPTTATSVTGPESLLPKEFGMPRKSTSESPVENQRPESPVKCVHNGEWSETAHEVFASALETFGHDTRDGWARICECLQKVGNFQEADVKKYAKEYLGKLQATRSKGNNHQLQPMCDSAQLNLSSDLLKINTSISLGMGLDASVIKPIPLSVEPSPISTDHGTNELLELLDCPHTAFMQVNKGQLSPSDLESNEMVARAHQTDLSVTSSAIHMVKIASTRPSSAPPMSHHKFKADAFTRNQHSDKSLRASVPTQRSNAQTAACMNVLAVGSSLDEGLLDTSPALNFDLAHTPANQVYGTPHSINNFTFAPNAMQTHHPSNVLLPFGDSHDHLAGESSPTPGHITSAFNLFDEGRIGCQVIDTMIEATGGSTIATRTKGGGRRRKERSQNTGGSCSSKGRGKGRGRGKGKGKGTARNKSKAKARYNTERGSPQTIVDGSFEVAAAVAEIGGGLPVAMRTTGKAILDQEGVRNGRWTKEEHQRFLDGIQQFNKNWANIAAFIGTRKPAQVRSHAQKYFEKLKTSATD